jgi:hypothetical protein
LYVLAGKPFLGRSKNVSGENKVNSTLLEAAAAGKVIFQPKVSLEIIAVKKEEISKNVSTPLEIFSLGIGNSAVETAPKSLPFQVNNLICKSPRFPTAISVEGFTLSKSFFEVLVIGEKLLSPVSLFVKISTPLEKPLFVTVLLVLTSSNCKVKTK